MATVAAAAPKEWATSANGGPKLLRHRVHAVGEMDEGAQSPVRAAMGRHVGDDDAKARADERLDERGHMATVSAPADHACSGTRIAAA
jgi:hypothetical protein